MLQTQSYVQMCPKVLDTKTASQKALQEELIRALRKEEQCTGSFEWQNSEITHLEGNKMAVKDIGGSLCSAQ